MASLEHEYAIAERPAALYELIRAVASALVGTGIGAARIAREVDRLRAEVSLLLAKQLEGTKNSLLDDEPDGRRPAPSSNAPI
jgi:hypothetical protein